jgi:hypothetical protein
MPRFVLLYHQCPPEYVRASHWDLMLEAGDVLRTWALGELPRAWSSVHARSAAIDEKCRPLGKADNVAAEQLGDHRRDYLYLEGPLSGNRGSVVRVCEGSYRTESETADCWRFILEGQDFSCCANLRQSNSESSVWTLEIESLN